MSFQRVRVPALGWAHNLHTGQIPFARGARAV